ncbi:O-acetylhomoserine aminocarboxypropyltransferase/cysteine synthase [Micrococcales bacterium 31B]|nr:O-acetylhomoserine aminocarboxypropyltransferase/cysteine synthase [Micrococcales bacterium 31B]
MTAPTQAGFSTAQVHGGFTQESAGARITPIYLTNGFLFDSFEEARDRFSGDADGFFYSRYGNPTVAAVERKLAGLEGGVDALAVASGQAALSIAFLTLLSAGDHVVSASSIYEGTRGLLTDDFSRFGIDATFVADPSDPAALRAALTDRTRVVFVESIPNPRNDVPDFALMAEIAHEAGAALLVDNTLATPYLLRPIEHGADVVVHSTSKYLSGHGSSLGGVVIDAGTLPEFGQRARELAGRLGPTLSAFNAFLLAQGMETLSLRMREHSHNALAVAAWLRDRPEVASVHYCGLEGDAGYDLAQRYLPRGQGAVLLVTLHGGLEAARSVVNRVQLFSHMTHLGDVRSLIMHPASTTHTHVEPADLAARGIGPGTLRLSVGIEDIGDLTADLDQALTAPYSIHSS